MKYLRLSFLWIFIFIGIGVSKAEDSSVLNITENDFVIGKIDAPITIIEYASMSCSHCASFHNNTLELLKEEFIDTGKVKYIFRDFPFNYPALLGSMVMRCVSSDLRYDYMNALYKLQKTWVNKENAKTTQELYKIMQSGGMTKEEFDKCIIFFNKFNSISSEIILNEPNFSFIPFKFFLGGPLF